MGRLHRQNEPIEIGIKKRKRLEKDEYLNGDGMSVQQGVQKGRGRIHNFRDKIKQKLQSYARRNHYIALVSGKREGNVMA